MKGEELEAIVLEHGDGVAEAVGEIAKDEEARAGTLDWLDEGGVVFAEVGEDDLGNAMSGDDAGEIRRATKDGTLGRAAMGVGVVAQDADGAEAEARLATEPRGETGDTVAGADEEGVLLSHLAKGNPKEQAGEETMSPKE